MNSDRLEIPASAVNTRRLLQHANRGRTLRYIVIGLLVAAFGSLFLPWQQSVRGQGQLTALDPSERPQTVPAVIGGRINEWLVAEGQLVKRGTVIARMSEAKDVYLDPETPKRYREQLTAKRDAVQAKRGKVSALDSQLQALELQREASIEKAQNELALKEAAVAAAVADSSVAADQERRREVLHKEGLASLNDLQSSRLKTQQAIAKLVEKVRDVSSARAQLRFADAEYADKIAKSQSERSATLSEVSEGEGDIAKLQNAVGNIDARTALYEIKAPQDGYVVRALRAGVGEQVKEGDPIVSVMPANPRLAVALDVSATDAPLVQTGSKVRLEFDGWPALQFSGWPSASTGTFGGTVSVVDQVAGATGKYRVLVVPDTADSAWPLQVRQGTGVRGWAMLSEVKLGYELWRRLNGFPPNYVEPVAASTAAKK